ncbi:MAG: transglutaminase-like domain-containing protein [Candidatus Cloacimonetes bacterium]|nr:transglutaminase-like domain-containing protein [Candidatus Cloacimonadota bacterium]
MKKIYIIIVINLLFLSAFTKNNTIKRIKKYSGKNSSELIKLYKDKKAENNHYIQFILDNSSANDLAVLTKEFLINDIEYAVRTKEFSYASYPEDIFKHFVLPYRASQEPIEEWRKVFYETLKQLVKEAKTIEEAAIIVNLWVAEQMTFKTTHGRDQAPLTTMKRGIGRCEEMMIIFIAAARSVGIPIRSASVPYWNFTNNNHAWVEIWTPEGWRYTGAAEPKNSLNEAWFSKTSERASLITSRAFGNYNSSNTIKQENNVTTISSIEYYNDFEQCTIKVINQKDKPVKDAKVYIYAASYGGLFAMTSLETDKNGIVNIPLGKGTVYVSAFKDDRFAANTLTTLNDQNELVLQLTDNTQLDENLSFLFPIPNSSKTDAEKVKILGDDFNLRRDKANLSRKNRLLNQAQSKQFVKYYDTAYLEKISANDFEDQKAFMDKADEIAGNYENFLKVFQKNEQDSTKTRILVDMLLEWDIKELVEIPDSSAIDDVVNIYSLGKQKYKPIVSDSLFRANVIHRTWRSAIPPENGWQKDFYHLIRNLSSYNHLTRNLYANNLSETVQNVINWVDKQVEIEDDFTYTYFSGTLNPLQILNMHSVPEFYRTKLINSALKQLGVPLQWKGRLEYYNGKKFVAVEKETSKKEQDTEQEISINIFVDEEQVKAEEWENFLIAKLDDEDGRIAYTFFEGENDSLTYNATYRSKPDDAIYIEAMVRNSNGDANIILKSLSSDDAHITLHLTTPKEYIDFTSNWSDETKTGIANICTNIHDKNSIIFVLGKEKNEPEERMYNQIISKTEELKEKDTKIILISQRSNDYDFIEDTKSVSQTDFGFTEIQSNEYPLIFLLNSENKIIFSAKGYQMGIAELLLKKIKH